VSTKYAGFIMRAHNRGDGGIMALAALARRNRVAHAAVLVTLGIFGASLFFGDGMITPAVSVLSAVSGLKIVAHGVSHLVVPISIVILVALFVLQRQGTGAVGWLFGPVTLLWFASIAAIGLPEVIAHPGVLQAISPVWAVRFFIDHGFEAFLMLGGVVLCVTGAEALYADRGHFGPGAIRLAWFTIVWPAVLLNYLGQAAWIIDHPRAPLHTSTFNPFFAVVPSWFRVPEVLLATAAAVIASQAVISGSYTVARQALQLGYLPRLRVIHTSVVEGQIYVPVINWILAAGVVVLVLVFQSSNNLANAYGLAVTGTFVLNTILFLAVGRAMWKLRRWKLALLGVLFLGVEVPFFIANLAKLLHGAWLPAAVGAVASTVMLTWRTGQVIVTRNRRAEEGDLQEFLGHLAKIEPPIRRVPGTAIFLNPTGETTPLALRSVVEHTYALPERVLLVSVVSANVPHVRPGRRFRVEQLGTGGWPVTHISIRNGYRDPDSVPEALALARRTGQLERALDLEGASYYISKIAIAETTAPDMAMWRKKLFLAMARNAATPIEHFGLPAHRTVIMGSQISL
ncbi:MAG: potassium transporter Kup, partial [Solirubrobacteraceae bacterium]